VSIVFLIRPIPGLSLARPFPLLALLIALSGALLPTVTPARADQPLPPIPWATLALPKSSLPHHSKISAGRTIPAASTGAGKLHTASFAQFGRLDGYHETVHWTVAHGKKKFGFTLGYAASIFADGSHAAAMDGDACQSLWEYALPFHLSPLAEPAFHVYAAGGRQDIFIVLYRGPVELEFDLQIARRTPAPTAHIALGQLSRIAAAITAHVERLVAGLPSPLQLPATPPTSPLVVSPPGTGPVVKSPSLMAIDPSTDLATAFDPGMYRPATRPAVATLSTRRLFLLPQLGLSRYVRTARQGQDEAIYHAVALYPSTAAADQAWRALARNNDGQTWLQPLNLGTPPPDLVHLQLMDAYRGWQTADEQMFAVRRQNVVMVLAEAGHDTGTLTFLLDKVLATVPTSLHAQGTQIVDASGTPVRLEGLNWYGFDQQDFVVGGLDFRPYQDILQSIVQLGYNSIRLPFSDQLVEQNPVVTDHVGANPDLKGLHAMDIMDRIITQAGALGLSVILDNHRSEAGWSAEQNGLWYTDAYPDALFVQDWSTLAQRYAGSNVVIGADLRNEPHGPATWGDGNPATDWHLAAERAGDAVLAANPTLLVIVEGIQFYGAGGSYWWGGNLMGVADAPVGLRFRDGSSARSQLVYSAHDYGKDNCAAGCPWLNATTTYSSLAQIWDQHWGYIAEDPTKPYAAPVWLGEFGTCNYAPTCVADPTPGSQGQWFSSLLLYLQQHNFGWAYWTANGTQSTAPTRSYGAQDWYGLFSKDWSTPVPTLDSALRTLQQPAK
jgi:aryl-phospho-beta-D-glucosidase BglC (GH1 family)